MANKKQKGHLNDARKCLIKLISPEGLEALDQIQQLQKLAQNRYVSPYYLAVVYAELKEKDKTLDELEKSHENRFNALVFLQVEPIFTDLQKEKRFKKIVETMGLPINQK